MTDKSIDLVVVNYKTYPLVSNFIKSYEQHKPKVESNLWLIDNETDRAQLLDAYWGSAKIEPMEENLGYARACNYGASLGNSKYIAFFNSDTRFVNDYCVDICVDYLEEHDDVAVVGPLQYSSEGKVTHGGIFGTHDAPKHRRFGEKMIHECRDIQDAVTVSGSAYFTKRSVWEEMMKCDIYEAMFPDAEGAFPPFPHFFEETLYSYHIFGHDYKCVYFGKAEMIHEWHKSSPIGSQDKNFKIGQKLFREFCNVHGIPHD